MQMPVPRPSPAPAPEGPGLVVAVPGYITADPKGQWTVDEVQEVRVSHSVSAAVVPPCVGIVVLIRALVALGRGGVVRRQSRFAFDFDLGVPQTSALRPQGSRVC